MSFLKLKEVMWEITLKCGKGCKYCGSRNALRPLNPDLEHLHFIATDIGSYGVEVVTLTGGEPGELAPPEKIIPPKREIKIPDKPKRRRSIGDHIDLNYCRGNVLSYGVTDWNIILSSWDQEVRK